jgi:hypothetical protein
MSTLNVNLDLKAAYCRRVLARLKAWLILTFYRKAPSSFVPAAAIS